MRNATHHDDTTGRRLQMVGEERWVDVDGCRVRYFVAGDGGTPVILLHGLGESAVVWLCNMAPLANDRRVIALDLPGHGATDRPDWQYSLAGSVRFMAAFLDALGIERAAFVGNSLGGLLAMAFACEHPDRVSHLVLEDSAGLGGEIAAFLRIMSLPIVGEMMVSDKPEATRWLLKRVFHKQSFATPALVELLHAERSRPGNKEAMLKILRVGTNILGVKPSAQVIDKLEALTMPTLVVWGREDSIFPVAQGVAAARRLPNSQLRIFNECGHWPHIEVVAAFNGTVRAFLAG